MNNKILVIGGTGTVGSAVVAELMGNNADYAVLTRNSKPTLVVPRDNRTSPLAMRRTSCKKINPKNWQYVY